MKPSYIWHVALGVGMGTRETRERLSDADILIYRTHLDRALALPAGDPVPNHLDYRLAARTINGALLCTVGHGLTQAAVCTFSVVSRSAQRVKTWEALHQGYPHYQSSRGDVPQVPYCAVRAEFGLSLHLEAGVWLDDYQIAISWSWIVPHKRPN